MRCYIGGIWSPTLFLDAVNAKARSSTLSGNSRFLSRGVATQIEQQFAGASHGSSLMTRMLFAFLTAVLSNTLE
jgi:hypothetical protein